MPSRPVELIGGRAGEDPALELAVSAALLDLVAAGRRGPVLRCYRPLPTVAFGRRDGFLPGFPAAAAAARRHGFAPVLRAAGGRAAAYDGGCLVVDEIMPAPDAMSAIRERFADGAARQAQILRGLGVDARVGEVPGEYCPGEFSVNARGEVKLIGAAQRIIRGGWLFGSVVVVRGAERVHAVLDDVYRELGLDWDPASVGAVADEAPGVTVEDVRRAVLAAYGRRYRLQRASVGEPVRAAARRRLDRHRADSPPHRSV